MNSRRPTLGLIGAGRAGSALAVALVAAGYSVAAVHSRSFQHAQALAVQVGAEVFDTADEAARHCDLLLLAVPDDVVSTVVTQIADSGGFRQGGGVAHISGSMPRNVLAVASQHGTATGVFHPLQALTGPAAAPLLRGSYIGIESDPPLLPVLQEMVLALGAQPLALHGNRVPYHIAAVMASSFPLTLLAAAAELMQSVGLSTEEGLTALLPLARGSLLNLEREGPVHGLTGPVVRGDTSTVSRHLAYLDSERPELAALYREMVRRTLDLLREGRERREVARLVQEAPA